MNRTQGLWHEYGSNGNLYKGIVACSHLETRVNGTLTETRLYDWDTAGNLLTTTTNGALVQENAYDVRNQLTTTTSGGIRLDNAYNGEGFRVSKRTGGPNGPVERFQLDGDRVVLETDGSGNTLAVNVYGTNLLFRTSGSDTYAYLYNGHADVTALVQPDGQVAGTWYYDAFGVPTEHTGVESPYTYAGYRYDGETGLYYLNARMYDPELARFLQEDTYRGEPNDPLSLNLYAYCHNEPLMYSDPTGHFWEGVGRSLKRAASVVVDAASGYAYSFGNMVMDTERALLYEPLACAAEALGAEGMAKGIRGTVSQAQSDINARLTANVTNNSYFTAAKAGMDVAQVAYAAGGIGKLAGRAILNNEKIAAAANKVTNKVEILAQKAAQKSKTVATDIASTARSTAKRLVTDQGGYIKLPGSAGGNISGVSDDVAAGVSKAKDLGREPIFADNDFMIAAAEKGNAGALAEIRAGTTYATPTQYREFLNVNSTAQRNARATFFKNEGIQIFGGEKAGNIAHTPEFQRIFKLIEPIQGRGDAALGAFAKATGYEAVTMERRLSNLFNASYPKLGVPIRRFN